MTDATRIARLEHQGRTLLRRIRHAQTLYASERLQMAWGHVQAAITDLQMAKMAADFRPREYWEHWGRN